MIIAEGMGALLIDNQHPITYTYARPFMHGTRSESEPAGSVLSEEGLSLKNKIACTPALLRVPFRQPHIPLFRKSMDGLDVAAIHCRSELAPVPQSTGGRLCARCRWRGG